MGLSEILLSDTFLLSHRHNPEMTVDFSKGNMMYLWFCCFFS